MKKIIFLGFLLLCFFSYTAFANSEIGSSLITSVVVNFNSQLLKKPVNADDKASIVKAFCSNLSLNTTRGFSSSYELYDARQSVFLYLICNNNELESDFFRDSFGSYLKTSLFSDLKVNRNCRKKYGEDCNVVELSDYLMNLIFSEAFSFKHGVLLGLTQWNFANTQLLLQKINLFAKEKFGISDFCTDSYHNYSKTCDIMKGNMKPFLKRVQSFSLINAKNIYSLVEESLEYTPIDVCSADENYDLMVCGLIGESINGLRPFISFLYNELAWYVIFMDYYTKTLETRTTISKPIALELGMQPEGINRFLFLTNQTLSDLVDFSITYPIHIGLLSYQEDILRFRDKSLSKIITPFYMLYHKLRNVQTDK